MAGSSREGDPVEAGQYHRPLDDVLQLANVARPVVGGQPLEGVVCNRPDRLSQGIPEMPEEMIHEQGNVLPPFAQRGDPYPHHVEPVEEILAEAAVGDFTIEVAGSGGEDPDVHLAGLRLADRAHLLVLEDA